MKAILVLFMEQHSPSARDSEKYVLPNLTKVCVTINGSPSMLYKEGIVSTDLWVEASRFFVKEKNKTDHMNLKLFLSGDKFGLLHGRPDNARSSTCLVNTTDGIQLELERTGTSSGNLNCQFFVVSDSQFNILERQVQAVEF